jgi:hypothetical protein
MYLRKEFIVTETKKTPDAPPVTRQKVVSLKEDGYYSNCSMVEATPFDISILFGKMRPNVDEKGNRSLVEVYERQVYLSHMQARALLQALNRSLSQVTGQMGEQEPEEQTTKKQ